MYRNHYVVIIYSFYHCSFLISSLVLLYILYTLGIVLLMIIANISLNLLLASDIVDIGEKGANYLKVMRSHVSDFIVVN